MLFLRSMTMCAGLPALAAQAPDAGRRAERVKVSHAVAHDEDLAGLRDELGQRSGHDAGFHARVPLGLLRASAVEREVVAILDDGPDAAADSAISMESIAKE